jgi:hypothetical protein
VPAAHSEVTDFRKLHDRIRVSSSGDWELLRPLSQQQRADLNLAGAINRLEVGHVRIGTELKELNREAGQADRRRLGEINQRKKDLRIKDAESKRAVERLMNLQARLQQATALLDWATCCPVCGESSARLTAGTGGHFQCSCASCSATWGVRLCGSCRSRTPFLLPGSIHPPGDTAGGWLDGFLGCDVLAVPVVGKGALNGV